MRIGLLAVHLWSTCLLSGCAVNPAPPIGVPPMAEPAAPESHLVATLTTSWSDLITKADAAIPKCGGAYPDQVCEGTEQSGNYFLQRDGAWEQIGWGFGWEGAIWRHELLRADIPAPKQFAASMNVLYHARVGFRSNSLAGCGYNEPARTATVSVTGSIDYASDWHVVTTLNPTIAFTSSCDVIIRGLNVTGVLARVVNPKLQNLAKPLADRIAAATNVKPQMETQWLKLQQPIPLGVNAWLLLAPSKPTMGPLFLTADKRTLTLPLALEASPQIVLGGKPPATVTPLPPLASGNINPKFQVNLRGIVSFAEASMLLKSALDKQSFSLGVRFPQSLLHFSVADVRINGNGPDVTIALDIEGSAHGTLYLTGHPMFAPAAPPAQGGTIEIRNVRYSIETKNVLANLGDLIFHNNIEKLIQDKAKWDISPQLADIRQRLVVAINHPLSEQVELRGELTEAGLGEIWVSGQGMEALARATGTLEVSFHKF